MIRELPVISSWGELAFWHSPECKRVEERLDDFDRKGIQYCPARKDLYRAMDQTEYLDTRVAIIGQDPYPSPKMATGIAFSVPDTLTPKEFPPTLRKIFSEYLRDLHLPLPTRGSLVPWTNQGVFLWNAIPSCKAFHSKSHEWSEWQTLTTEIIKQLNGRGIVFVFLGATARQYAPLVTGSLKLEYPHPAARGNLFRNTRMFSSINAALVKQYLPIINWRLP